MTIETRSKDSRAPDGMHEHVEQDLEFVIDYSSVVIHEPEVELSSPTAEEEDHPPGWAFF